MDVIDSQRGAFERLGPTDTGQQAGNGVAVTGTAQNVDLNAAWGGATQIQGVTVNRVKLGGAWFSFQARGGVAYVRFKSSASAASTTALNGFAIADGATEEFWVPSTSSILDVLGSGALSLLVWMSSRNYRQT